MKRKTAVAALLLVSAAALTGMGRREQKTGSQPPLFRDRNGPVELSPEKTGEEIAALPLVRVSGRVRITGGGLMNEFVISGADGEWLIEEKDQEQFRALQQKIVTVEGRLDVQERRLINSSVVITRSLLRNAKIILSE
ncbi:MAG: hypothetical protein LBD48_04255 [Treponema sp.]|nr:hypothetical protein [Treponema sp.]